MENRERDRVSQRTEPTDAGQVNREVEEQKGRDNNPGTDAEFGQKIGRAEEATPLKAAIRRQEASSKKGQASACPFLRLPLRFLWSGGLVTRRAVDCSAGY